MKTLNHRAATRAAAAALLGLASLAAQADTAGYARSGSLLSDMQVQTFDFTIGTPSDLRLWTTTAATGFDTFISLFDLGTGALISFSDDVANPYPQVDSTQSALDAGIVITDLMAGQYRAAVSLTGNVPLGSLGSGYTFGSVQTPGYVPGAWSAQLRLLDAAPVPEPSTSALFLVGLLVTGAVAARRRS